jgi:hypothetical protein
MKKLNVRIAILLTIIVFGCKKDDNAITNGEWKYSHKVQTIQNGIVTKLQLTSGSDMRYNVDGTGMLSNDKFKWKIENNFITITYQKIGITNTPIKYEIINNSSKAKHFYRKDETTFAGSFIIIDEFMLTK